MTSPRSKEAHSGRHVGPASGLLPEKKRLLVLTQLVTDERTTRRLSAYKAIKDIGDRRLESTVVQSYAKYGDEEALITLLRIGGDVSEAGNDVAKTISNLSERYHQALAIQRILVRDERLALSLAEEFPMAFIWAASRAGYFPAKPFVMTGFTEALNRARACTTSIALFEASRELPLFVWALGKLGAVAELNELAREYNITFP